MNLKTELFLAYRYLKPKRNAVSVITYISIMGVILGVGVLIVVIAVMTGFSNMLKDKMLETTAHLNVYSSTQRYINNPYQVIKKLKATDKTLKAMPVISSPIIFQKGEDFAPKGILGIDPDVKVPMDLESKIIEGKYSLKSGEVLIGSTLAQKKHLFIGDKVLIHTSRKLAKMVNVQKDGSYNPTQTNKIYLPDEFKISGIFKFDKYSFDNEMMFINIDDASEMLELPWGSANIIYGWVDKPFEIDKTLNKLKQDSPYYRFYSWKDLNGNLLDVIGVEKTMMFFILIFVVLVAAFSITNTLITVVIQKTREIGMLKSLGATSGTILRIFLIQGLLVGVIGTVGGCIFGQLAVYFRNDFLMAMRKLTGMELFPKEFYHFSELPAEIITSDLIIIMGVSIVLCTIGGIIPAIRAANLDPVKALRYE